MAQSFARRVAHGTIEAVEDLRIGERVDTHPDRAVGQRIGFEGGAGACGQCHAARDARATLGTAGEAQQQMQRRAALSIEHLRDRALPAARFVGGADLRQDRVANPLRGGNALDRQDLRQSFGPRDAHFVVDDVVHDEGATFDTPQLERWAGDTVRNRGGRQDFELPVVQQRAPAPQPVKERQVSWGGAFPGNGDRRREG